MSKYEDEALELIELVAENSHHHAVNDPLEDGVLPQREGCWM